MLGLEKLWHAIDVLPREITHEIIQHTCALNYRGETEAMNEHLAEVFGILFKQYCPQRTRESKDASWVIFDKLFTSSVDRLHDEHKPRLWEDGSGENRWVFLGVADDSCYIIHERATFDDQWACGYLRSFENPKLSDPAHPLQRLWRSTLR